MVEEKQEGGAYFTPGKIGLRQRSHWTESVWNQYEIGTDKPSVYTGPDRSGTDRNCYQVPNGSTCKGDPIWSHTVQVWKQSCVNGVDLYHSGSDFKQIRTYPILC